MKWFCDLISRWFGWETYEEAYTRLLRELPPPPSHEDIRLHNEKAEIAKELIRRRLDGPNGEYKRGIEGLQ
jgi:hypothetical protein